MSRRAFVQASVSFASARASRCVPTGADHETGPQSAGLSLDPRLGHGVSRKLSVRPPWVGDSQRGEAHIARLTDAHCPLYCPRYYPRNAVLYRMWFLLPRAASMDLYGHIDTQAHIRTHINVSCFRIVEITVASACPLARVFCSSASHTGASCPLQLTTSCRWWS